MDELVGGSNAILLLLTVLALGGAVIAAFVAMRKSKRRVARALLGGAGILAIAYGAGVLAASASSIEQTLPAGETKWFCGFYLDCHLGVSIERTETVTSITSASGEVKADGAFRIVTVKLHNSARNPAVNMLLYRPDAKIVDADGREYNRSSAAEAVLAGSGRPAPLSLETKVTHQPVVASMVFDLPANAHEPRLMLSAGWIVDRMIELGLINDENSIFHRKTLLALNGTPARTASGVAQ